MDFYEKFFTPTTVTLLRGLLRYKIFFYGCIFFILFLFIPTETPPSMIQWSLNNQSSSQFYHHTPSLSKKIRHVLVTPEMTQEKAKQTPTPISAIDIVNKSSPVVIDEKPALVSRETVDTASLIATTSTEKTETPTGAIDLIHKHVQNPIVVPEISKIEKNLLVPAPTPTGVIDAIHENIKKETIQWVVLEKQSLIEILRKYGLSTNQAYAFNNADKNFVKTLRPDARIGFLKTADMMHVFIISRKKIHIFHAPINGYHKWSMQQLDYDPVKNKKHLSILENPIKFVQTHADWVQWHKKVAVLPQIKRYTPRKIPIAALQSTQKISPQDQSHKIKFLARVIKVKYRYSGFFEIRKVHPVTGVPGKMHYAVDLRADEGSKIYAVAPGIIKEIGNHHGRGWGRHVVIEHANGYKTRYAHMKAIGSIRVGDRIKADTVIGTVGQSGGATGPHLHLELIYNGKPINPLPFLVASGLPVC